MPQIVPYKFTSYSVLKKFNLTNLQAVIGKLPRTVI